MSTTMIVIAAVYGFITLATAAMAGAARQGMREGLENLEISASSEQPPINIDEQLEQSRSEVTRASRLFLAAPLWPILLALLTGGIMWESCKAIKHIINDATGVEGKDEK